MEQKIERFFNTAGPIKKDLHYFIEPLHRMDLKEILSLIRSQKYFVIHAPRQTGKTSLLLALMDYLNQEGIYKCLYINVEDAQAARENIEKGMKTILSIMAKDSFYFLNDSFFKDKWKEIFNEGGELEALNTALMQWCEISDKPVVLFIDEVDALVGDTLISLLRQLRSGYHRRPGLFPQSVILCGVRDVRDYRIHSSRENDIITGGSAFNVKSESLRLGNFTRDEIKRLYEQHTSETGQEFSIDIFPLIWKLTEGQPWVVNALGYEACFRMKESQDRKKEITMDTINQAKENLIIRRDTHIDQLLDKLNEERVRRVIEPILAGSIEAEKIPADDVKYTEDLGLITGKPQLSIANQIYKEVIPRELTYSTQLTIRQETRWYVEKDGRLNMDKLLTAFQEFFRKHFESWIDGYNYKEAGPQLLLQAFLQRVLNDNGRVEREYGLGRQRTDLHIIWPFNNSTQEIVVELKLRYDSLEKTIEKGLEQTQEYMDKCGASAGYLLIFDRSKKKSWKEKIFKQERTFKGEKIIVYGM
jgi:hypothetical protein